MLGTLPNELLLQIAGYLNLKKDLVRLCLTSKLLHDIAMPLLYQSITLWTTEQPISFDRLSDLIQQIDRANLVHTKHLCLKAPIHTELFNRCPHLVYMNLGNGVISHSICLKPLEPLPRKRSLADKMNASQVSHFSMTFARFVPIFLAFVQCLKEDSLQSFKCELGTCVPWGLFRNNKTLLASQTEIKTLSLIINRGCRRPTSLQYFYSMEKLTALESLRWKGLFDIEHYVALRRCLVANGSSIKTLDLDFIDCSEAIDRYDRHSGARYMRRSNFFSGEILQLRRDSNTVVLPQLKNLSLTATPLIWYPKQICHALNFPNLTSLRLVNCSNMIALLEAITVSHVVMNLKRFDLGISFEVLTAQGIDPLQHSRVIRTFLKSFVGLEDLYLSLDMAHCFDYERYWGRVARGMAGHSTTLKRTVTVAREFDIDVGLRLIDPLRKVYTDAKLVCLSSGQQEETIAPDWELAPSRPRCRIFHYRRGWDRPDDGHSELVTDGDETVKSNNSMDAQASSPGGKAPENFECLKKYVKQSAPAFGPDLNQISRLANGKLFGSTVNAIHRVAEWAFSEQGFPDLEIFAFGDFSHEGRFADRNWLLCRNESYAGKGEESAYSSSQEWFFGELAFRFMTPADTDLIALLEEHIDFLAASPVPFSQIVSWL